MIDLFHPFAPLLFDYSLFYCTYFQKNSLPLVIFFVFVKMVVHTKGENFMSNQKFRKIVVYLMIFVMIMSSLLFGLSFVLQ
ncbi:stressosome-associated protein Prli42 [Psychrobacillus sp. NEAU-3TGS]|uniref:stressosome-associated protein Prli42 n=1 Tax=Psychrobacillus sp. NEAU-3TGS TaxID=2995412 RepID=UPI0032B546AB